MCLACSLEVWHHDPFVEHVPSEITLKFRIRSLKTLRGIQWYDIFVQTHDWHEGPCWLLCSDGILVV